MDLRLDAETDGCYFCGALRAAADAESVPARDRDRFYAAAGLWVSCHCPCCGTGRLLIEFLGVPNIRKKNLIL